MDHGDQPRRGRRRLDPGLICYTYVYIGILEGVSGVTELFDGRLVFPDDAGWEEALYARVFNGRRPDRRPDAVLVAASVADVQRGVRLAAERGWQVAVRSGGHSLPVWSIRDGGLLIDLGALDDIEYDEATHIVTAGPAVLGGRDLYPFLAARGRFFNGGHHPTVGLGGFLLQGGHGWAQREWGWGAESVVAVDVVTADGELIRADQHENADLFWAARGAGPGFPGIVVRFHLRTQPMFGHLGHTFHVYEMDVFDELMAWVTSIHRSIARPVELVVQSFTDTAESTPVRRLLLSALAFTDDRAQAEEALAPFAASPVLDRAVTVQHCAASSLDEHYAMQDHENPPGLHYLSDNIWLSEDVGARGAHSARPLRPLFDGPDDAASWTIWISTATTRPVADMAFSPLSDALVNTYVLSEDPADHDRLRAWLDEAMAEAADVAVGQYVGEADLEHSPRRFLLPEKRERLERIIAARDPNGRFAGYLGEVL